MKPRILSLFAVLLALAGGVAAATPSAAQAGLKKTIAVDSFGGAELTAGMVAADGLTAMLTDVLIADGRFVVVERAGLGAIQTEQQLGQSGSAGGETAAQSSRLIGAGLLVRGAITKYNPNAGTAGVRVSGLPGGALLGAMGGGLQNRKTSVAISLRLIDTTTGQVISTVAADGVAATQEADAGLANRSDGSTLGLNALKGTALGKAVEDAIKKAVERIALDAGAVPWSGLVVESRGPSVYINAGADQNVAPGMVFAIYRKGEALTDPGTGTVLDVEMTRLGRIRVDTVREKVSVASLVDGQAPARGDLLRAE
ncbi:CsgG/HfaB family protein [Phenylobacterium sp. J367]|uniref:CsgG/HfaB family protein n=1 Tax=Phenylobacterium sp. J367 TaxID=2898435 RepID=UPI002150C401|nr:CsgG/HfaB family protein [Phenylobacterium sp. J367]MCR5879649.1 CsgG/HfaB family protein [Phenylobacterium sp. J367]